MEFRPRVGPPPASLRLAVWVGSGAVPVSHVARLKCRDARRGGALARSILGWREWILLAGRCPEGAVPERPKGEQQLRSVPRHGAFILALLLQSLTV
jgi:hypothetical protein